MIAQDRRDPTLIPTVTEDTFRSLVLDGAGPIAVEFMSYGCAHCRALEPVLQQAAQEIRSTERIFRVNVAVEQDLASRYAIEGTPTLVMFAGSQEVGRAVGPHPVLASVLAALTGPFAP